MVNEVRATANKIKAVEVKQVFQIEVAQFCVQSVFSGLLLLVCLWSLSAPIKGRRNNDAVWSGLLGSVIGFWLPSRMPKGLMALGGQRNVTDEQELAAIEAQRAEQMAHLQAEIERLTIQLAQFTSEKQTIEVYSEGK